MARGCICGKARLGLMFVTDGVCWWCGHGTPADPPARDCRRRRLPWDLGTFVREGRRPDPCLENVVRLDRLTVVRTAFLPPVVVEEEPRECAGCGGHFDPIHGRQLYCTTDCQRLGAEAVAWSRAA